MNTPEIHQENRRELWSRSPKVVSTTESLTKVMKPDFMTNFMTEVMTAHPKGVVVQAYPVG